MWPQPGASSSWGHQPPPHASGFHRHPAHHEPTASYEGYVHQHPHPGQPFLLDDRAYRVDGVLPAMAQPSSHSVGGHSSPSASTTRGHHAYHPYHAPQSITFVDASQQAEAASRGEGPTDMQCKPKRKRILPGQLERLLEVFEVTDTPSYDVRERLSAETGMTNREVWFQNRRAKVNRARLASVAADEASTAARLPQPVVEPDMGKPTGAVQATGQHQWRLCPSAMAPPPAPSTFAHPAGLPSPPPTFRPFLPQGLPVHPHSHSPPGYTTYPPAPSPFYLPHHQPTDALPFAKAIGPPVSFGMITPPLSVATPSLASPGTASLSSYFPFTPSELPSPSGTFFRLSLDSPHLSQLRSPLSPQLTAEDIASASSPVEDGPEPRIHLPPMRSSGPWPAPTNARRAPQARPMHYRSISDSFALPGAASLPAKKQSAAATRPAPVRLPSLRGLLNNDDESSSPSLAPASLPTFPVDYFRTIPVVASPDPALGTFPNARSSTTAPAKRPSLVSRYSTVNIHAHPSPRRIGSGMPAPAPVPAAGEPGARFDGAKSARSASLGRSGLGSVASGLATPTTPANEPVGIGLGMLVAAATELRRATDDERIARLAAAKEMC